MGAVIRAVGTVPLLFGVLFELLVSLVVSRILVLRLCKPSIAVVVVVFLHLANIFFILTVGACNINFVTSSTLSRVSR